MNKKTLILIVILVIGISGILLYLNNNNDSNPKNNPSNPTGESFDYKIIHSVNSSYNGNYLISPLSIAYALSIVNEGTDNNTKNEISNLLGNYKLYPRVNVKERISIANSLFVKNKYKNDISQTYLTNIQDNYDSDIIFDDYERADKINNWVNEKTYKMIPKILDRMNPDFVLGIANAIAIDVEWKSTFSCHATKNETFTKIDGKKMQTAMMNTAEINAYIESDNAKGIIKDYAIYDKNTGEIVYQANDNTVELEYIAILPNNNIKDYINSFNENELNELLNNKQIPSSKLEIYASIPKYTYDFDYDKFKDSLISLGMKDAFDPNNADFGNMINKNSNLKLYIGEALHKTHIELSEKGTKAAAITYFGMLEATAVREKKKEIHVEFNKPFIYIIKEKNSSNIWFFGTVYEPMKWEDNKPEECEEY